MIETGALLQCGLHVSKISSLDMRDTHTQEKQLGPLKLFGGHDDSGGKEFVRIEDNASSRRKRVVHVYICSYCAGLIHVYFDVSVQDLSLRLENSVGLLKPVVVMAEKL